MRSGRLVMLPRASISRTESISSPSLGGRRMADSRLKGRGDGVALLMSAGSAALAAAKAPSMASAVSGGGLAVALMVGRAPEELDETSRKPVPVWNGYPDPCTGVGAGRSAAGDGSAGMDDSPPTPRFMTMAGLPRLPMLALLTSLLSSPSSSCDLKLSSSVIGSSKNLS